MGGVRHVQQAVPGRLGPTLRGLNGLTCRAVLTHLKNGPSRADLCTSNVWLGTPHKPDGLTMLASFVVGRVVGLCCGSCRWVGPY